jgi:hypothetical protein
MIPVAVTLAYRTVVPVPNQSQIPGNAGTPGTVGAAMCATLQAYERHIENLMLLVDLLFEAGGAELQNKLAERSLTREQEGVKASLQLDALVEMRSVLQNRVSYEIDQPELDVRTVEDSSKQD